MKHLSFYAVFSAALLFAACSSHPENPEDPKTPETPETSETLEVTPTSVSVPKEGGTYELAITSNIQWQVESSAAWLTYNIGRGRNNATLTVTAEPATTTLQTVATITVYNLLNRSANSVEVTFTREGMDEEPEPPTPPEEDKPFFTLSDGSRIIFSSGNLQYQASTQTWRFAENQYDAIGSDNKNISATYSGWIDLFGFGTSGYNGRNPYTSTTNADDYGNGNYSIAGTNYDWGVYNTISDYKPGTWRTPTSDEWIWLVIDRPQADRLRGHAQVNGIQGFILLPDDVAIPEGITFVPDKSDYSSNTYTLEQWQQLEKIGAVFLPVSGSRHGKNVNFATNSISPSGYYWSSTIYEAWDEYVIGNFFFSDSQGYDLSGAYVHVISFYGMSVRLVKDIK